MRRIRLLGWMALCIAVAYAFVGALTFAVWVAATIVEEG